MSPATTPKTEAFARILVGIDASEASLVCLEWAGRLARGLELELNGLFIEDINLINLSGFPFAREFGLTLQSERRLSHDDVAARLRSQADAARQALARLAGTGDLRWSFQVLRGDVGKVLIETAQGSDLIVVGACGAGRLTVRLGSSTRGLIARARAPVLVVGRHEDLSGPVVCLYDGTAAADRALAAAVQLALVDHKALDLVVLAGADDVPALRARAQSQLNDFPQLQVQFFAQASADWHAVAALGGRVVVLPADHPWVSDQHLERWMTQVGIPVLVTR